MYFTYTLVSDILCAYIEHGNNNTKARTPLVTQVTIYSLQSPYLDRHYPCIHNQYNIHIGHNHLPSWEVDSGDYTVHRLPCHFLKLS